MKKISAVFCLILSLTLFGCGGSKTAKSVVCTGDLNGVATDITMEAKGDSIKKIIYKMSEATDLTDEEYESQKELIDGMADGIVGLELSTSLKDGEFTMTMSIDVDKIDFDDEAVQAFGFGFTNEEFKNNSLKVEVKDLEDSGMTCK